MIGLGFDLLGSACNQLGASFGCIDTLWANAAFLFKANFLLVLFVLVFFGSSLWTALYARLLALPIEKTFTIYLEKSQ